MIEASGLTKRFGTTQALAGVDLVARTGTVLGVLGPNGAGKTTALRILTTLTIPDGGHALVAGIDVVKRPQDVRRMIGVAAQDATLDEALTGRQNLTLAGELSQLAGKVVRERSAELLELFELVDAADRVVKTYSGGMRRRLDLAASVIARPQVLFLDEPTTGLDPASRQKVWTVVRNLVHEGVTVLLTTQYLDEADQLADRIAIVDHGLVIAENTPSGLKRLTRGATLEVLLATASRDARTALASIVDGSFQVSDDGRRLRATISRTKGAIAMAVRALDERGIEIEDISIHQPSLDDVFMRLTGDHSKDDDVAVEEKAA